MSAALADCRPSHRGRPAKIAQRIAANEPPPVALAAFAEGYRQQGLALWRMRERSGVLEAPSRNAAGKLLMQDVRAGMLASAKSPERRHR